MVFTAPRAAASCRASSRAALSVPVDSKGLGLRGGRLLKDTGRASCSLSGPGGVRTADDVAAFCRSSSKHKVRAALVVVPLIGEPEARAITSIDSLLSEIATV
ncbi:hypothetical protein GCM10009797_34110 [Nocardioides hwasunensis]